MSDQKKTPATRRPNILYFMCDQLRADWLGCTGHKVVKTPNIDALAAHGTVFDQFYVASPVCMPNRASFMTGRYPSLHGLRYNGCALPTNASTFVDVLAAEGYKTASIGKSHLQPFRDATPSHLSAIETGPVAEAWAPRQDNDDVEQPKNFKAEAYDVPLPYYGYQHADVVTGHGDTAGGHYRQWLASQVDDVDALLDRDNQLPHTYNCPQAFRTPVPPELYTTSYVSQRARNYLQARAGESDPFFAFVSFPDPHHPFNPPGKYWDAYDPDNFTVPTHYQDHKNPPPPLEWARRQKQEKGYPTARNALFMAEDRHIREAMALTAGMISLIDDAVGEVIAALKASGRYDDTVIIFNSDHGDYLGDCSMMLKGPWSRESTNRVPFIWSDPDDRNAASAPVRTEALCSTIDIGASLIDRIGSKPYYGMQGRSFLPVLAGEIKPDAHREELLVEYNSNGPGMGFEAPPRVRTFLTADWQMIIYGGVEWGELYDRNRDPDALHNLWDEPDYADVRGWLSEQLCHHLIGQMDESPRAQRAV